MIRLLCAILVVYFLPKLIEFEETKIWKLSGQKHRLFIHFTAETNWMNDPNGMVYYNGEYHLFFQYYPESTVWRPMHWGHAVSKDLMHWEELPIVLYPEDFGYIFSGSAVIDWNNTKGLQDGKNPLMVTIFTPRTKWRKRRRQHYPSIPKHSLQS